jgi:SAM-dependent methyltransferase
MTAPREQLRRTFDEVAELYDRARPAYPAELYDDLARIAGLAPGARVLEIGCGTGQATRDLARRGYAITCIELGKSLAAVARRRLAEFGRVEVVTSSFEDWEPRGAPFDLVFAATSWHWLDPDVRYVKAAEVLAPGSVLGLVTTGHVLPEGADPFFAEVQEVYEEVGEGRMEPLRPEDFSDDRADIEASELFGDVQVCRYLTDVAYTADEYIALLETFSGHRVMEPAARERLYRGVRRLIGARPDRVARKHYLFVLHVAHKL